MKKIVGSTLAVMFLLAACASNEQANITKVSQCEDDNVTYLYKTNGVAKVEKAPEFLAALPCSPRKKSQT